MTAARKMFSLGSHPITLGLFLLVILAGCEPPRYHRVPVSSSNTAPLPRAPQTSEPLPPPPPASDASRPPFPQDPRIREQDIRSKTAPATPSSKDNSQDPSKQASIESRTPIEPTLPPALSPPLPDDSSLLAKIAPGIPPQRAASLRLADEGRKLIDGGEPSKALTPLERSMSIDSTNPYGYFYLAKAQYRLGRFKESLNFLDVAESRLSGEPFWIAEVHALRGDNFRAQGQLQRAEVSYNYALKLNSGNRTATDGLARLQGDTQPASR
ncbi:MAG: hypothetical protein QOF64_733 [Candidatus Binatota bacterium]|nr:hypothetical protein [Candidatus Binatota bacterium]